MDPVTGGIFLVALYKALEKVWDKAFGAAWGPVDKALKEKFTMLAGKDKTSERWAAFKAAHETARALTIRQASDRGEAERIFEVLDGKLDKSAARDLADEASKLLLASAEPDLPRMTQAVQCALKFEALFGKEAPPAPDAVAFVLKEYLYNLREALLNQEAYHDLIEKDMRRALREIVKELRPVEHDTEATYRTQLAEMHRNLEFVGIPEIKQRRPITVEDIFIRLRAQRDAPKDERELLEAYRRAEAEGDEKALAELHAARNIAAHAVPTPERAPVQDTLREVQKMVILGDPGAGKTTLLKYLTVICGEGRGEKELGLRADGAGSPLPIFILLREFAAECAGRDCDYALLDYLYTYAREHLMLHLSRDFFEDALEKGRCLVLLDGLDEVWAVGQRKKVTDAVHALAAKFPSNRYVVTSRIVGYDEAPLDRRAWAHHTILPLGDDDIHEFVRKWYALREPDMVARKQKTEDLIATIDKEPRIKTLAENPLLLTIIALVHRIEAQLPHERVKLYDKCATALIETWDEGRGITTEDQQRPSYRYRRRLLERLAYTLHAGEGEAGQVRTVKEGDLQRLITDFLMDNKRLGFGEDPDGAGDEAEAFIRLARGRTGLLIERGDKVFAFAHLTFQEYLAACDIESRCMRGGVDAIWGEVKYRLMDAHWREVVLLLLGGLNKYEDFATLLVEQILEAGQNDKYERVLYRYLYLAARVLADRVALDEALHRKIVDGALSIVRAAPSWEGDDALAALSYLTGDRCAGEGLLSLARDEKVGVWVRSAAASALGQLGHVEEAAGVLLSMARDEKVSEWFRRYAARALGRLRRADEKVMDGLLSMAQDEKVPGLIRSDAVRALAQLGGANEKVLDGLLSLARDEKALYGGVRSDAARALGQLGRADEKVLDGLLSLARDEKLGDMVRYDAYESLRRLVGRLALLKPFLEQAGTLSCWPVGASARAAERMTALAAALSAGGPFAAPNERGGFVAPTFGCGFQGVDDLLRCFRRLAIQGTAHDDALDGHSVMLSQDAPKYVIR